MNRTSTARSAVAVGALVALTTGGALFARRTSKISGQQSSDRTFARKADQGGLAEVKLGHLAESKTQNPTVRAFAQRMIQDHTQTNNELQGAASATNINLPAQPDAKQQATYDRLSKLSGTAFDRAYATDQVKDHEHVISEFKKEAQDGRNPQIKQFAQNALPTLNKHLTLARRMYRDVENRGGTHNGATGGAIPNGATGSGGANETGGANGGYNGGANGGDWQRHNHSALTQP